VIVASGGSTVVSRVKAATTSIPIVFLAAEDPVRLGLVASLARPGGNLTGINFLSGELAAKRLDLLHELLPRAVRVAVLVNPADARILRRHCETSKRSLATSDYRSKFSTPAPARRSMPPSAGSYSVLHVRINLITSF